MVAEVSFRENLNYRICEMVIHIPPLRERQGDKILLARHLLQTYAKEQNRKINGFTPEATEAIEAYEWPGNIREMENKIKRAVHMCDDRQITAQDLDLANPDEVDINLG